MLALPEVSIYEVELGVLSSIGNSGTLIQSYRRNNANADRALERLTTGKRINRPSDDPAGFVSAELIRGEIVKLRAELKSVGYRRSAVRMEQSALSNIQGQLTDLKGLLVGAADGLLTTEQRQVFEHEIDSALQSIERIEKQRADSTLNGGSSANGVAAALAGVDASNPEAAAFAVEAQTDSVSFSRAALAAYEKYELNVRQYLAEDSLVTHTEALSQIEDADFAVEASNLAASQVLADAALIAMSISREQFADHIEALLEGVEAVVE